MTEDNTNQYPKNNNKYSWKDLQQIAIIVDKSYHFIYGVDKSINYYKDIEKNTVINCLLPTYDLISTSWSDSTSQNNYSLEDEYITDEVSIEEINEKPIEEINEKPIKEINEKPIKEINEKPIEEIIEEPIEKTFEEPNEKIIEEPIKEINEKPIEEPIEVIKNKKFSSEYEIEYTDDIIEIKIDKIIYIKSKKTDSEFFVIEYFDNLIIIFVGSDSNTDWAFNIKLNKERIFLEGKFCDIHKGFYEQYYSIKDKLINIVKNYYEKKSNNGKVSNILITGHSLGVIGQLCGINIKKIYNKNINLDFISFGAPCVGNYEYVDIVNNIFNNNIRLVNNEDIIPVFLEIFGYTHSGNIIMFDKNNILYESNTKWVDIKNVLITFVCNYIPFFGTNLLYYHLMPDYIKKINSQLND
jgi:hypothetical protein